MFNYSMSSIGGIGHIQKHIELLVAWRRALTFDFLLEQRLVVVVQICVPLSEVEVSGGGKGTHFEPSGVAQKNGEGQNVAAYQTAKHKPNQ